MRLTMSMAIEGDDEEVGARRIQGLRGVAAGGMVGEVKGGGVFCGVFAGFGGFGRMLKRMGLGKKRG